MPILKILPDAISNTASFVFGNVTTTSITANGTNLGTAVAEAFLLANNAAKSTTSDTAPANPNVGDTWFDTVTNVLLRYTNDGVSNNWIDISGPQNAGFIYQSYSLSSNTTSLNESGSNTSVAITISTINITDNTTLYWTISGSTPADFTDSANTGSVSIINNSGSFTRTLAADVTTEGAESFVAQLRTGSTSGPIVAIAPVITVADTSRAPIYALYTWGGNGNGALGLNDRVNRSSPTQVGTDTNWSSVKTTGNAVYGVKTNGTLWSCGYNAYGELGQNNVGWPDASRSSPTQVGTLTNWSSVFSDGGSLSTFAIKNDGTLWAWGSNQAGRLGLNDRADRSSPVQVGSDTNWSFISNNNGIVVGLKTTGSLWFIGGFDINSQFTNSQFYRSSPTQIGAGSDWSKISNNQQAILGIRTNGTLWSWGGGDASAYIIGRNTSNNPPNAASPTQLGSATNWVDVYLSSDITATATKSDGTVWVWGANNRGQLGLNDTANRSSPTQLGLGSWATVKNHASSMAIKTDGTLWTWGMNYDGSLGDLQSSTQYRSSPVQIGSNTNWGQISPSIYGAMVAVTSS